MTPIEIAYAKAKRSYCNFKISAIALDHNGKVLAYAINQPRFDWKGGGYHAEMLALRKGGPRTKTIILCRVGGNGKILPIQPCPACRKVLNRLKIKVCSVTNV